MNHLSEEQLVLHYYGEGPDRESVAQHLEECAACRANHLALRRVLGAVSTLPVPERAEDYGAEVWRQVRPRIARESASARRFTPALRIPWNPFRWPRPALAGAFGLLLVAAFLAGRFWPGGAPVSAPVAGTGASPSPLPRPLPAAARERVLLAEIADHLERSQVALVELIHSRTNGPVDITAEQVLARELSAVNRLFRITAADSGEPGMASVLEELELVLVEIANGPSKLSAEEFAALRQRLDSDGLLFKVRVLSAQMRVREQANARDLAGLKS